MTEEDPVVNYRLDTHDERLRKIENGTLITKIALIEQSIQQIRQTIQVDEDSKVWTRRFLVSTFAVLAINVFMWAIALLIRIFGGS